MRLDKINKISYSISTHYFQHLVPIYGIKTLFKIYKHQIKVCQVHHALFHDYTLFILSPFILLGPKVMWVPCHNGMAHSQFADGEDGLQLGGWMLV
jgi:hypothetical protein